MTGSNSIQISFCQRCGISIPEADIDTGRAQAAPGGYVCVGCIYQARDEAITAGDASDSAALSRGAKPDRCNQSGRRGGSHRRERRLY